MYTDKITDATTKIKENIETLTVSQENFEIPTTEDYLKTDFPTEISDFTTVSVNINTKSLNSAQTFETVPPKNHTEVTTKVTVSNENDITKNMATAPSSVYTEDVTQEENKEVTTEFITEIEETRDDTEISTETIKDTTLISTKITRRTLGVSDYAL
ncbi:hypothetical protein RR46_09405 [Papilio xuthus]|uniref:Uncharacterized protein n=1 Tax=Papilio xuthus TaxID=66420 RepID=A0A194PZM1_PAPXU|nr:hypothetical protein RR46_09405 [Papilio xuthus]